MLAASSRELVLAPLNMPEAITCLESLSESSSREAKSVTEPALNKKTHTNLANDWLRKDPAAATT